MTPVLRGAVLCHDMQGVRHIAMRVETIPRMTGTSSGQRTR